METWPIRFDTVKDMPGAMQVASSGQFVEFEDFEKLLHICAGMISTKAPFDTTHPQQVANYIIQQIKEDLKNG